MGKLHVSNKIRSLKTLRTYGHRCGVVLQPQGDEFVTRPMPEHYNDANSKAQQPCRNKMKWVMQMHALLKDAYKGCFQGEKSDYHQFRHYNMLSEIGECIVSHGSLPSLNTRVVGSHLEFDMKAKDWRDGDILRFVGLPDDLFGGTARQDIIIGTPKEETVVTEELPSGYYSFVHLRPGRKGFRVSTQKMVQVE